MIARRPPALRPRQSLASLVICAQLVIGIDDEDDVEACRRRCGSLRPPRIVVICVRASPDAGGRWLDAVALDVDRVDPARGADPLREMNVK